MKIKHITEILDKTPVSALSEQQQATISAHTSGCAECRRAFEAARISAALLRAESREISPSPFFQAKVMNAWRERQKEAAGAARRQIFAFRRWWQASAAPVFMMLTTLAILISLTILAPRSNAEDTMEISEFSLYSTDAVILNQRPPRELTTEQVFEVIYNSRNNQRTNQK